MLRWSQMWRWHFRYQATIELTHNPVSTTGDGERLGKALETAIRQIKLPEGYRVAGVKVEFKKKDDNVHLENDRKERGS